MLLGLLTDLRESMQVLDLRGAAAASSQGAAASSQGAAGSSQGALLQLCMALLQRQAAGSSQGGAAGSSQGGAAGSSQGGAAGSSQGGAAGSSLEKQAKQPKQPNPYMQFCALHRSRVTSEMQLLGEFQGITGSAIGNAVTKRLGDMWRAHKDA